MIAIFYYLQSDLNFIHGFNGGSGSAISLVPATSICSSSAVFVAIFFLLFPAFFPLQYADKLSPTSLFECYTNCETQTLATYILSDLDEASGSLPPNFPAGSSLPPWPLEVLDLFPAIWTKSYTTALQFYYTSQIILNALQSNNIYNTSLSNLSNNTFKNL